MPPFDRLGPYIIEKSLGSGGMGSVFLGVDDQTGEQAAIKVLNPALGADPSFRERFGTEIETLKKLRHPHIVQLLGFGEEDGQLFYAMEMVEGRTLQQELQAVCLSTVSVQSTQSYSISQQCCIFSSGWWSAVPTLSGGRSSE